jgi:hypothetical protein
MEIDPHLECDRTIEEFKRRIPSAETVAMLFGLSFRADHNAQSRWLAKP